MKILAIDTSTEACSAALNINGEILTEFEIAPQQHSQLILGQCDKLLAAAQLEASALDAVSFGCGPGSFTGLRIAAGVTQGIAFAADLPVIAISTLAAQAQQIASKYPSLPILSAIDARMKEVYWGLYRLDTTGIVISRTPEQVCSALSIHVQGNGKIVGVGSGWKAYSTDLQTALKSQDITNIYADTLPSAEEIALLAADKLQRGETLRADKAVPVYLRNNVAIKTVDRKR